MRSIPAIAFALCLIVPAAIAGPVENHAGVVAAADRLLEVQLPSGAFPWIVGSPGEFQNVQGITALGLLDAYKVTLDERYLEGAAKNRDWIAGWMAANPTSFVSAPNAYFLAEYAVVTQEFDDLELARQAFQTAIDRFGSPSNIVLQIIHLRANVHKLGNLGIWDAALWIRAAHDIGNDPAADTMANALQSQGIVNPLDATATYYELGLAGLVFGLGEAELFSYAQTVNAARDALLDARCEDGSWPVTFKGTTTCGNVQATAFAVEALNFGGDPLGAQGGCDWLAANQHENGGWVIGTTEYAEVDAEAATALAACVLPARNAVTSYLDDLRENF